MKLWHLLAQQFQWMAADGSHGLVVAREGIPRQFGCRGNEIHQILAVVLSGTHKRSNGSIAARAGGPRSRGVGFFQNTREEVIELRLTFQWRLLLFLQEERRKILVGGRRDGSRRTEGSIFDC